MAEGPKIVNAALTWINSSPSLIVTQNLDDCSQIAVSQATTQTVETEDTRASDAFIILARLPAHSRGAKPKVLSVADVATRSPRDQHEHGKARPGTDDNSPGTILIEHVSNSPPQWRCRASPLSAFDSEAISCRHPRLSSAVEVDK
jgi:hypothetical protein